MQISYSELNRTLSALVGDSPALISALSNAAALLYQSLPTINWAGFYLCKDDALVLGPFSGKTACVFIPFGKGVCGTAAQSAKTLVVPDVHQFKGHIACDCASESEIVVPLLVNNRVVGVLDIDSPVKNRFSEQDKEGLEQFAAILCSLPHWNSFRVL